MRGAMRCGTTAIAALACVAAMGCGDDSGGGGQTGKPATLKVGVIPIADVAPLYLGREKGFFKAEKLTIKPQQAAGGAAITPAVVSGDEQIGKDASEAWADLLVPKSASSDPKALEGKTIAVNTLNNICEVTIKASLEKKNVAVDKLKFTEVPFPDMNAALDTGRVDGACAVEPFMSQGKAGKSKGIDPFYVNTAPDLTVATYFTSKQYAEKNPDVVDRFVRAMNKSLDYAQSHPAEVRKVLLTYTKIPPEAAQKIKLPIWRQDLNEPTIEQLSSLSKKYGLLKTEPKLDDLIRKP
jgi:NitT/TauT family transport system substrate-binding protein